MKSQHSNFEIRLRRLRQTKPLRELIDISFPSVGKFVQPIFVVEGSGIKKPISSLPGQHYLSVDTLVPEIEELERIGIRSILLFPALEEIRKSVDAAYAFLPEGLIQQAVSVVRSRFADLNIISDVCLSEYTPHGHSGILDDKGTVLNDATVEIMTKVALSHARAGATIVAPSAMMDGQVKSIRSVLDENGFKDVLILSYSTKFASNLYEPFRQAAASAPRSGDRCGYQVSYANFSQSVLESLLDAAEGADLLMVKPLGWYLDVLKHIRSVCYFPIGGFQVSGEYVMMREYARASDGDLYSIVRESLVAPFRAGADFVITYWAKDYRSIFPDRA